MRPINKLHSLEILRFLSALSVLFWHYKHFWYKGTNISNSFSSLDLPLYEVINFFYDYGYLGVPVFWAISGYVFFHAYFNNIKNLKVDFKNFFISRFSRLYPLHFITLLIVLALQLKFFNDFNHFIIYEHNDLKHFILNLLLISHWGFQEGYSYNAPIWSVSIEILVYIIFFFLARFFKTFFVFSIAGVIFAILVFFDVKGGLTNCVFLFFSAGYICLIYPKLSKNLLNISLITLTTIFVINIFFISEHYNKNIYFNKLSLDFNILFFVFLSIKLNHYFENINLKTISNFLGNLTYSIYLLQIPFQLIIFQIFNNLNITIPKESVYFLIFYITTIIILSYYSYKYIELPLKNYFRKKI